MSRPARILAGCALFAALVASRLCHLDVLWTEEAYPAAAAIQMLHGKALYRDIWYDKPPLSAAVYLLWGAHLGLAPRLAAALYLALACFLAWLFASRLWGPREGLAAAGFLAFFLIFDIPSALLVLGPDLLMLVPHLAAVYLAWRGKAFWSGLAAGAAFLFNAKGLFVLAACVLFCPQAVAPLIAGFALPNAVALALLAAQGSLAAWWLQVWQWGFLYSRATFLEHPVTAGVLRTLNWSGFHAALVIGSGVFLCSRGERPRLRFALWTLLSLAAAAMGWRFFPRYYFQLLPVAAVMAARGFTLLGRYRAVLLLALIVPFVRFAPRYGVLALDQFHQRSHDWSDLLLSDDAQAAARIVQSGSRSGDTLLVWGYRPEVFAETRMAAGSRFLDSQPLTGVVADRHLTRSDSAAPALAAANRQQLQFSAPAYIVDGLGPLNPALAITRYPDLRSWFAHYREIGRTRFSIVYRRAQP